MTSGQVVELDFGIDLFDRRNEVPDVEGHRGLVPIGLRSVLLDEVRKEKRGCAVRIVLIRRQPGRSGGNQNLRVVAEALEAASV